MNLGDRTIPLEDRVRDFLENVPHGTRLDLVRLVADLAREAGKFPVDNELEAK